MPYIVNSFTRRLTFTNVTYPAPKGHQEGDLLLVCVSQDVGSTAISVTGYTEIGVQSAIQAQRLAVFYKIASNDNEQISVQSGGPNVVSFVVLRHVHPTTPIHAYTKTDSINSTTNYLDSGQVTTTLDGCLLLYVFSFDGTGGAAPNDADVFNLVKANGDVTQSVGYKIHKSAGTTSVVRMLHEQASEGGSLMLLAIADATPASPKMPPALVQQPQVLGRLGAGPSPVASARTFYRHENLTIVPDLSTIVPTSLFGRNVLPPYSQSVSTGVVGDSPWTYAAQAQYTTAGFVTGQVGGALYSVSPTDFSHKIFSYEFYVPNWNTIEFIACYFEDSSGRWAAYRLTERFGLLNSTTYRAFVDLSGTQPDEQSAQAIDPTQIVKFAFLWGYDLNVAGGGHYVRNALLITPVSAVGGLDEQPLSFYRVGEMLNGWGAADKVINSQGSGQTLLMPPVHLGDGTSRTIFKARAEAVEFPFRDPEKMPGSAWRVGELSVGIIIKGSPYDVFDFTSASIASKSKQYLRIDESSSATASYLFNGAVLSGLAAYFDAPGITLNNITFSSCYASSSEANLNKCIFYDSVDSVALVVRPDRVTDCTFVKGDSGGHAIEITQPGTFSFVGNTFEGYGLDGTTDAAIYNNSGGHVTLNVSGGGDTPTVRNGAGATTDVVSGAQITVVGLAAGSQVKVTKVSNGDVLFNGAEAGGQISFSTTYIGAVRVEARKASVSPFYRPWATQATTISGQTVEVTALQELDE